MAGKWKKKIKKFAKKAGKAALVAGALYAGSKLLKKRKAASMASMDDAARGVTHPALQGTYITKKDKTAIIPKKKPNSWVFSFFK